MQEKLLIIPNILGLIWYNSELSIPQALAKLENYKNMYRIFTKLKNLVQIFDKSFYSIF